MIGHKVHKVHTK